MHRITALVSAIDPIRNRLSPKERWELVIRFNTMTFFFSLRNRERVSYEIFGVVNHLRGLGHHIEIPT